MLESIIKRDGTVVPFDQQKIFGAIYKANNVVHKEELMTGTDIAFVTDKVVNYVNDNNISTVEGIQDVVEKMLIKCDFSATAKEYIVYRAEHNKIRNSESYLMDIYNRLTYVEAQDDNDKRENANIDGDTAMGTMLKYGSEGSKYFIDNHILPKDISLAHTNGEIHIHDKDFYMLTATCCQIDLLKLFKDGFSTGHGFIREPSSIESYCSLACIAIQANQNEMHGGQSVPNFDYSMAPGVIKTYRQEFKKAFVDHLLISDHEENNDFIEEYFNEYLSKDFLSKYLESINAVDSFINCLIELYKVDKFNNDDLPFTIEEIQNACEYAKRTALKRTDRRCYQGMESLVHNLCTMSSRAGAQVPFSSLNYGTDTSIEGRMATKNLLLATEAGLGNGETAIFPVQIFKVKEGVNYNPEDPNYDLFRLAMKVSAKRLFPNFSNLDAPFNKQYYDGTYNSEVSYMGCRTRVMGNTFDPSQEITSGRGNLSFTTVNLPRIVLELLNEHDQETKIKKFFEILDERVHLVFRQLIHRLKIQSSKKVKNFPFLMGEGIWLDSDKLSLEDTVGGVFKHGTLTIGFIGLAETLVGLIGKHHGESTEAQELGLKIVGRMRELCDIESEKDKLNFSLIATPAESLSGRFVTIDKKKYGVIEGITDKDYYVNSFHVPPKFDCKIYDKINIEAPYHALTNAGHISYTEISGDLANNIDAFESIIRCMHDAGIGYGSVNHPVDRDPVCGYIGIIGETCPRCGRKAGEALTEEQLEALRKKYGRRAIPTKCCS